MHMQINYTRFISTKYFFLVAFFLFLVGYLKLPIIADIKIHYIIPIIFILYIFLQEDLKITIIYFLFFILSLSSSLFSYLAFDILSYDISRAVFCLFLFASNFIIFFIAINLMNLEQLLKTIYFSSIFYSFFVLWDIVSMFKFKEAFVRYQGTFQDPNYIVILFLLFIATSIYYIDRRRNIMKLFSFYLVVVYFIAIFVTFSRSGYLASVIFLITFLLLSKNRAKVFSLFLIVCFVFSIFILNQKELFEKVLRFLEWRFFSESEITGGMSRVYETKAGFNFFVSEFPLSLAGMGIGSSEITDFFSKYYDNAAVIHPRIHNTFASILFEQGILSFIIFFIILVKNFNLLIKNKEVYRYFMPLYLATLVSSLFIWNLYYLPFYIAIFYIPYLAHKEIRNPKNYDD